MTAIHISDETVLVDNDGVPLRIVSGSLSTVTGEIEAQVVWGKTSINARRTVLLNGSNYSEQFGVNSQMSIISDSGFDQAAGDGARSALVKYYDSSLMILKQTQVSLGGLTATNFSQIDMCFIESVEVLTAGISGSNIGTLSLYSSTNATGNLVATIGPNDGQTFFGHHYIGQNKRCWIKDMSVSVQGGVHPVGTFLKKSLTNADQFSAQKLITEVVRCGTNAYSSKHFELGVMVDGPAKISQYIKSDGVTQIHVSGSFVYYEEDH